MANKISPYALAYHLAGVMDGDWDDGIERFVGAHARPEASASTVAGAPAHVMEVTLETEDGDKQEFEIFIFEKQGRAHDPEAHR